MTSTQAGTSPSPSPTRSRSTAPRPLRLKPRPIPTHSIPPGTMCRLHERRDAKRRESVVVFRRHSLVRPLYARNPPRARLRSRTRGAKQRSIVAANAPTELPINAPCVNKRSGNRWNAVQRAEATLRAARREISRGRHARSARPRRSEPLPPFAPSAGPTSPRRRDHTRVASAR